jgi:hypothetical protein
MSRRSLNLLMSMDAREGVGQKMLQLEIRMSICSGLMPGGGGLKGVPVRGVSEVHGVEGVCVCGGACDVVRPQPGKAGA